MVKFSRGMWWVAPDITINWAVEIVKSEAFKDYIRAVAASKHIGHRGDTLNLPTITLECASPIPDVLRLSAYHWKGQKGSIKGPDYELLPDVDPVKLASERQDSLSTSQSDSELKLSTKTLSATVNTQPYSFGVDIKSHGVQNPTNLSSAPDHLLTKLGWRSVGYVKHATNDAHPNSFLDNPDPGDRWMTMQFQLSVGEKIYGLGERFGNFIKNGQTVDMWNEDGGTSSELTYKNVPFLLSSRGYGIFVASPGRVSFEIQSERTTRINIAVPFESMNVYVIHGPTPAAILERYTLLTGRPALPPPWTFGLWLTTSFTTNYGEETVNGFLKGMEDRDIAVDVFHYDCFWMKGFQWCDFEFDAEFFPDAKSQLSRMRENGYKICVWINPYIAQESKIFDEGMENGYFIKKHDGSVWQFDFWQAGMAFVDFTNPEAWKWYQSKLRALLELGVDCFKTDFGERIPTGNVVYHDGSNPEKMHNYYAFLYNKCTFEVTEEFKGKNEALVFARAATAGGQRFPVHWGGDPMSTFEAMAETLRGGLSLGMSGFGYWAHDIGGFEGNPDPALYKRWFAFGALSSHSRLHGSGSFRVPWLIDETGEADVVLKKFINLKLSLMPYFYSTAIKTHQTGVPMMRPTFVEYPEDPIAWTLDTQYLLGPSLLVAPVFNAEGIVQYYIPEGSWYGIMDGKVRKGPGYVVETHDFSSIPLLLRPGHAVLIGGTPTITTPSGKSRKSAAYDYTSEITVLMNTISTPDLDVLLDVPDVTQPGQIAAVLRVKADSVCVETGSLKGSFKVKKVVSDGSVQEFTSVLGGTSVAC